jgi:hypothetical protein
MIGCTVLKAALVAVLNATASMLAPVQCNTGMSHSVLREWFATGSMYMLCAQRCALRRTHG